MSEPLIIGEPDFLERNGTFLLTALGLMGGCVGSMMVYFLKSRCSEIKLCWGCVNCVREPLPADVIEVSANPRVRNDVV
jgi:hypothetical protein